MAIRIKQIVTKLNIVTVGAEYSISADEKKIVAKISYCRKGYNKGYQGDFPSYKIDFEESPIRLIIPEKSIEDMLVEKIEEAGETIPELPDDTVDTPYPTHEPIPVNTLDEPTPINMLDEIDLTKPVRIKRD